MKKRVVSVLLVTAMILSGGCKKKEKEESSESTESTTESTTETTESETELETAVLRALFPDDGQPALPHCFQPPYLLDDSGGCFVTQK